MGFLLIFAGFLLFGWMKQSVGACQGLPSEKGILDQRLDGSMPTRKKRVCHFPVDILLAAFPIFGIFLGFVGILLGLCGLLLGSCWVWSGLAGGWPIFGILLGFVGIFLGLCGMLGLCGIVVGFVWGVLGVALCFLWGFVGGFVVFCWAFLEFCCFGFGFC